MVKSFDNMVFKEILGFSQKSLNKFNSAFSIAEAFIMLTIVSVALAAAAPMITKQIKHNNLSNVQTNLLGREINQAETSINRNTTSINNINESIAELTADVEYILDNAVIQGLLSGNKNYDNDIAQLREQLDGKLNSLQDDVAGLSTDISDIKKLVPSGTIIFYDGTSCPSGWSVLTNKYPNAKNAFIRNLDGSGRSLGNWQQNAAPEISGSFDANVNDFVSYGRNEDKPKGSFYYTGEKGYGADGDFADFSGHVGFKASLSSSVYGRNNATEIRPDNIAFLACRKN